MVANLEEATLVITLGEKNHSSSEHDIKAKQDATEKNENYGPDPTPLEVSESSVGPNMESIRFYTENDQDIPYFPQDFEVAKYDALEKISTEKGKQVVVIELQCSQESCEFPFRISAHFSMSEGFKSKKQFIATKTSEEVRENYEIYVEDLKNQDFLLRETFPPGADYLASMKLQELLLEEAINSSTLSQEISAFVELIWAEALGHLDHLLLEPVNNISLNDVSKGEGILLQIKNAMNEGTAAKALKAMMMEFYRIIRHKSGIDYNITKKLLSSKQDLCQLIRDMLNVCETSMSSPNPPSLAKYRALRCKIQAINPNSEEFLNVKQQVLKNNHSDCPVKVLQIYRVGRISETAEFLSYLGNVQSLFHASFMRNFVGILSRGLLLPKIVVEDHGMERTDIGNLGSGIYFNYALPSVKLLNHVKTGLQDTSGNPVPLEDIHIKGRIIDFIAQIIVFQTYTNQNDNSIEAKYVFPLDNTAAVCGFEAFINGKHIVGKVKEKEQAHKEYREAISRGDGAYLMDQDAPDVFTVSVGNLPPKTTVLIKVTYITELSFQNGCITFQMPAAVAPWQQDKALNENTQDTVKKVCVKQIGTKKGGFCVAMSIEMPYSIERIHSWTHTLKIKKTDCKAVIRTVENSSLDISGFALEIWISQVYLPRMWVEKHPNKESEACMLVFQPKFETRFKGIQLSREIIICLDCSNSMEGSTLQQAKQIALHALQMSCFGERVNVIRFGTNFTEFSSYSKNIKSDLAAVKEFIISATPTMGNTDLWKTLRYLSLLYPSQRERNILLLSDGHIQNESMTFQIVKENVRHTRLFTCGVGSTANHHILRSLSQYGAGAYEYFDPKSKYNWLKKIESQTSRIFSPGCSSVSLKWQQFDSNAPEPLQAPAQIQSLFNNERLLVYGFIPRCTQATLNALINDQELQAMVSTTELQKTTGTLLHKLTARALIRDYEDGILHENETEHEMKKHTLKVLIINLSLENSIITQFTSFVAVEKRDVNEVQHAGLPNILELIAEEDIDFLPYMDWEHDTSGHGYLSSNRGVGFGRYELDVNEVQHAGLPNIPMAPERLDFLPYMDWEHDTSGQGYLSSNRGVGESVPFHEVTSGFSDHFQIGEDDKLKSLQFQSDKELPLVKQCILPDSIGLSFIKAAKVEYDAGATEVGLFASISEPQAKFSLHSQSLLKIRLPEPPGGLSFPQRSQATGINFSFHAPCPPPCPPEFTQGLCPYIKSSFTPVGRTLKKANFEAEVTPEVLASPAMLRLGSPMLQTAPKCREKLHHELSKDRVLTALRKKKLGKTSPQMRIQRSPSAITWTQIFELQNQDGFWNLSPELGVILGLDVDYLTNIFLAKKGIWSLGPKGRGELLQLIATLLVLQFIRYNQQLEGITFKSLMKLDDSPTSSAIHWAFASVKKAVEWSLEIHPNMAAAGSGEEAATAEAEKEKGKEEAEKGKEEGAAAGSGKAAGDAGGESEEEEDVFEVEKILDVKTEGGKILYKVRWKGYTSDDDTWEPEVHLEDCKEVLLEFRKKIVDNKPKPVKKDIQKLSLNDDLFEAESDSDLQSEAKEDTSPKKKKKKSKDGEDRSPDDLKKKKSKSAKFKEKPRLERENSSDSLIVDSKPKKRTSETKEDSKDPKKQKKEDSKEIKKKKGEIKDLKTKCKEDSKENKKLRKEKHGDLQFDSESSTLDDSFSQAADNENSDLCSEGREEKQKIKSGKEKSEQEIVMKDSIADRQLDGSASTEEDSIELKVKRKKKKLKKAEDYKEESRKVETKDTYLEKKNMHKKQKAQEKAKASAELDKVSPTPALVQKGLKLCTDEKGRKSTDSVGEYQEKEVKKNEIKEKPQKRYDSEKEEKGRKEQKGLKSLKENKSAFDLFNISSEEKNEYSENNRKREDSSVDYKFIEEFKSKENKQLYKERRSTRDETDTWTYIAAEGDREVDNVCQMEENSDGRQQVLSLGMDMQLEWLTLEDFQKHLDGEDETHSSTEPISSTLLRDAVKNGDYVTVKMALNSNEEYNLDQEDSSGMTLVMLAAAGGHDDLLRLLIRKGAKVNCRQKNGTTALIHAAEKNFLTTVAILLEAGAYLNVQQSNGETALMKACKRGNSDIVRLMIESGADCNILSKHQNSALHFAKQCNNVLVYDLLKSHLETLSRVAEDAIRDYFEARLALLEPVFPIACHRLCEGPDFSMDFNYKPPQNVPEGSGILLFVFHSNFFGKEVIARLCGPCSVQAVVLNDKFQLPVFLDSHFIYSFSPVTGLNKLFIRLTEALTAKVKLLIGAYRVQLQ
ncbi:protein FAM98A [Platysternon megacephalum]|uniref:Poly [ADP-ribose] polymerase n=1 Tax=Platysternon megacephalum TaxID=55544 RepID=A0A4D9EVX7_9SAUR|nr:protein FAM98A [Platysternon megacephalum]